MVVQTYIHMGICSICNYDKWTIFILCNLMISQYCGRIQNQSKIYYVTYLSIYIFDYSNHFDVFISKLEYQLLCFYILINLYFQN